MSAVRALLQSEDSRHPEHDAPLRYWGCPDVGALGTILCQTFETPLFCTVLRSDTGETGKIGRQYSHVSFNFSGESMKFAKGSFFTQYSRHFRCETNPLFYLFLKFRTSRRSLGVCSAMALMSAFCTVSCETLCEFAMPVLLRAMLISVFIQH